MTPEVAQLRWVLDRQRQGILKKLSGLSEADARRSTVDSGTNIAGLVQHLTFVEARFREAVEGTKPGVTRSMQVDESTSLRTLRADYRTAYEASNALIEKVGDGDAPVVSGKNLRSAMLAVMFETGQHLGHADIIREQIDGQTGR